MNEDVALNVGEGDTEGVTLSVAVNDGVAENDGVKLSLGV